MVTLNVTVQPSFCSRSTDKHFCLQLKAIIILGGATKRRWVNFLLVTFVISRESCTKLEMLCQHRRHGFI